MIKEQTSRRIVLIALFALLAVGSTTLLTAPRTEAIEGPFDCDTDPNGAHQQTAWLETPAALERSQNPAYCTNSAEPTCREECLVHCGASYPQGNFDCFAN